jgi:hypothetical protein
MGEIRSVNNILIGKPQSRLWEIKALMERRIIIYVREVGCEK